MGPAGASAEGATSLVRRGVLDPSRISRAGGAGREAHGAERRQGHAARGGRGPGARVPEGRLPGPLPPAGGAARGADPRGGRRPGAGWRAAAGLWIAAGHGLDPVALAAGPWRWRQGAGSRGTGARPLRPGRQATGAAPALPAVGEGPGPSMDSWRILPRQPVAPRLGDPARHTPALGPAPPARALGHNGPGRSTWASPSREPSPMPRLLGGPASRSPPAPTSRSVDPEPTPARARGAGRRGSPPATPRAAARIADGRG